MQVLKKNKLKIIFICFLIYVYFFQGNKPFLTDIEDQSINPGAGTSLNRSKNEWSYELSYPIINIDQNGNKNSKNVTGSADTIGETREKRQLKMGKQLSFGLEEIMIFDESYAKDSVRTIVNILFKNTKLNDTALVALSKDSSSKILSYKPEGYDNSSEYISEMIKNCINYNFFDNDYSLNDLFLLMDAEGKNIVIPYIKMNDKGISIAGMGLFKKDKLNNVIDLSDARLMNIMRENNVKGMLTIKKNSKEYINYYATSKRKIKCYKVNGKYKFIIDINLSGDIISNTMYKNLINDINIVNKFKNDMAKQTNKDLTRFIYKMQNVYKIDCLNLGSFGAAKYGRGTKVDWNEIVSSSDVEINVKVKVDNFGI